MPDNEQAGTPEPVQDGGIPSGTGTPAKATEGGTADGLSEAVKQELESLRNFKEQALGEKGALSEARERLRELEAERQRWAAQQPPTGIDPTTQAAAQAIQNLYESDPAVAQAILGVANLTQQELQRRDQEFQRRENKARYDRELAGVPAERRAEVERIAKAENIWPSWADDRVIRQQWEKEKNDLAEQKRRLQEREEQLKRGVVKTTAEPTTSAPAGDEITLEENDRLIAAAERGDKAARDKLRLVEMNQIRIRYP